MTNIFVTAQFLPLGQIPCKSLQCQTTLEEQVKA